jgi:outer membrane biosynthesis protein TonB
MTDLLEGDERVDALYAQPLDSFIAARDALARELRSGGDRDAAASVKQLRKPSRPAWALNHVVRTSPDLFDAVTEAGAALLERQQVALRKGAAVGLREAVRDRQDAVQVLTDAAVAALGTSGESARDAIERTVLAASIDALAAAEVRSGCLVAELEPPDVFGTLEPGPETPAAKPRPARAERKPAPRSREAEPPAPAPEPATKPVPQEDPVEAAEAVVAAAEAELEAAAAASADAKQRASELRRAAQAAVSEADAADRASTKAAIRHDEAKRDLSDAERVLRAARRRA